MGKRSRLEWIDGGGVTSPAGFVAGATYVGVKTYGSEPRFDDERSEPAEGERGASVLPFPKVGEILQNVNEST